jgi:glutamate dehydrogenase (NAD(P)+)/glutamate dehydrogenase (NADP+)
MSAHYMDSFADELGPQKIIHIYEPITNLRAIVVIDNTLLGPSMGGVRMAPDVSTLEVFRLARAMTLKNALNNLPNGGGKSAILADPDSEDKELLVRAFARSIKELTDYIPGPDMGTDEHCMAMIHDEINRAVGLPKSRGGLPLNELGMTGFGIAVAADEACKKIALDLKNARVIIQGFGHVGKAAALFLIQRGAKIIGVSDINGALVNHGGIDIPELIDKMESGSTVSQSGLGVSMLKERLMELNSDIFIPSARPDVVTELNQHLIKTRLILEGANIPITHEAARILHNRGIIIIPDIIANAGGVICAASEFQGLTEPEAYDRVKITITRNTEELLTRVADDGLPPHEMATYMAKDRIAMAIASRGHDG